MQRSKPTNKSISTARAKAAIDRVINRHAKATANRAIGAPVQRATPTQTGYVDLASATYANDTTGSLTLVATIAQGTGTTQRVGKRAEYKSVQIRGTVFAGTSGTVAEATNLLVYDKMPTGALPTITDILVSISPTSMNNDSNSGRFRILRRWDYYFTGNSSAPATGREVQPFDEFVNLKGYPVVFKAGGTGAISDIQEGCLYLITLGDTTAGNTAPFTRCAARTRFIDIVG